MILKGKQSFHLISANFFLIGNVLEKLQWIFTYVDNLNHNLITYVNNWYYSLINRT